MLLSFDVLSLWVLCFRVKLCITVDNVTSSAWRTSRSRTNRHNCKFDVKHLASGKYQTGTECLIANVWTFKQSFLEQSFKKKNDICHLSTAICMPPCQNLGFCLAPNVCNCPDGFEGPQCQYAKSKPCLDKPPTPMNSRVVCNEKECMSSCNRGFAFPDGSKKLTMVCDSGNWVQRQQPPGKFQKVPDCQRNS